MKHLVLPCSCLTSRHQITFMLDDDQAYLTVHLNKIPFLKRIKYLLTGKAPYGCYEETVLDSKAIPVLQEVLTHLQQIELDNKQNSM